MTCEEERMTAEGQDINFHLCYRLSMYQVESAGFRAFLFILFAFIDIWFCASIPTINLSQ